MTHRRLHRFESSHCLLAILNPAALARCKFSVLILVHNLKGLPTESGKMAYCANLQRENGAKWTASARYHAACDPGVDWVGLSGETQESKWRLGT